MSTPLSPALGSHAARGTLWRWCRGSTRDARAGSEVTRSSRRRGWSPAGAPGSSGDLPCRLTSEMETPLRYQVTVGFSEALLRQCR